MARKCEFEFLGHKIRLQKEKTTLERFIIEGPKTKGSKPVKVAFKPSTFDSLGKCWGSYTQRGSVQLHALSEIEFVFKPVTDLLESGDLVISEGSIFIVLEITDAVKLIDLQTSEIIDVSKLEDISSYVKTFRLVY